MSIHDGHRQRLKDRFLREGLDGFTDIQVLELLLFYVVPRKDTNPIAHDLLERFGNNAPEFDADAVLLYKDDCDTSALFVAAAALREKSKRVTVCKKLPDGLKYKELYAFENGEVKALENNA